VTIQLQFRMECPIFLSYLYVFSSACTTDAYPVHAGQAVYTLRTLRIYDWLVLGLSNRFIWNCPTPKLVHLYNDHVMGNHLDVGVGTGYFLDHCRFPVDRPRLALLDLNADCLQVSAKRVVRYEPQIYQANVLEPIEIGDDRFDSIGLNYVLHCLPGSMDKKSVALEHLAKLLNPGGVLFGATLLGGMTWKWPARRLMGFYNRKGIFCNTGDDLDGLQSTMQRYFDHSSIKVVGCAALFVGRVASVP